ncbi:MAG: outer membrane protein [Coraliomargaritaceae bacterium]
MKRLKWILLSLATTALATANPYAKFSFGYLEPLSEGSSEEDFENTWIPSIEFGVTLEESPEWSVGFEYSYYYTDYSDSDTLSAYDPDLQGTYSLKEEIEVHRFIFVLNYEHEIDDQFTFLLSGGLGISMVEQTGAITSPVINVSESDDDTSLAYQLGVGLGYDVNESIQLSGRARYLGADELPMGGDNLTSLVFDLSAKFTF